MFFRDGQNYEQIVRSLYYMILVNCLIFYDYDIVFFLKIFIYHWKYNFWNYLVYYNMYFSLMTRLSRLHQTHFIFQNRSINVDLIMLSFITIGELFSGGTTQNRIPQTLKTRIIVNWFFFAKRTWNHYDLPPVNSSYRLL